MVSTHCDWPLTVYMNYTMEYGFWPLLKQFNSAKSQKKVIDWLIENCLFFKVSSEKSRIWDTPTLLTNADSITDTALEKLHNFYLCLRDCVFLYVGG